MAGIVFSALGVVWGSGAELVLLDGTGSAAAAETAARGVAIIFLLTDRLLVLIGLFVLISENLKGKAGRAT